MLNEGPGQTTGYVTPTGSIVTAATTGQNFDQLFFGILTVDHADFRALTIDY